MVNEEVHERVLPHTLDDTWEEEERRRRFRVRAFGGAVVVLVALAAAAWYVYPSLAEHGMSLAPLTDLKDTLTNGSKAQIADVKRRAPVGTRHAAPLQVQNCHLQRAPFANHPAARSAHHSARAVAARRN